MGRTLTAIILAAGQGRPFDLTGRAMKGWVMIPKAHLHSEADYRKWVEQALAFTRTLPGK